MVKLLPNEVVRLIAACAEVNNCYDCDFERRCTKAWDESES